MQTSTSVKFGTHHFPVGTIFKIKEDKLLGFRSGLELEVKAIIRNDVRSFVIESTTPDTSDQTFSEMGTGVSINICHVEKIIKRGTGPVLVSDFKSDKELVAERIEYIQERLMRGKESAMSFGVNVRKNEYLLTHFDFEAMIWLLTDERIDSVADIGRIMTCVEKSSLFRKGSVQWMGDYFIVKKKAFKKWLKQNINRFYCSLNRLEKDRDEMDQAMLDREFGFEEHAEDDDRDHDPKRLTGIMLNPNQKRIEDLIEKAYADETFKELDETLARVDQILSQPQVNLDVNLKNHPVEKKHEEDF